jgi:hypothetical protein
MSSRGKKQKHPETHPVSSVSPLFLSQALILALREEKPDTPHLHKRNMVTIWNKLRVTKGRIPKKSCATTQKCRFHESKTTDDLRLPRKYDGGALP